MRFIFACFVFVPILVSTNLKRSGLSSHQKHGKHINLLRRLDERPAERLDFRENRGLYIHRGVKYHHQRQLQHQYTLNHLPSTIGYRRTKRRNRRSVENENRVINVPGAVKLPRRRQSRKYRRASIHVTPKQDNPSVPVAFDPQGNIRCMWQTESRPVNMKLYLDSPRGYNEAYIGVRFSGHYYVYGQIFFHGKNVEMGHCLYAAETYPCRPKSCVERPILCSRSAPGHPVNAKDVENINTNYIGGNFYLKRGSTIRVGVVANVHRNAYRSTVNIDKSMSYFGAFSI
ncbi:unnamed protein product [Owenia fusiformis]|uniref:THD domain-containing protein n=1 Tax=Owenia fusiformis TaxID=6347 RepID=A0A8J1XLB3_OWEFU|nr:unnamed protein product [Owenia fusiformis]